ncbi:prolyl oligopeptidase family serine peptidase [Alteromonas ponticola]|uniref:Prolyl oligopeptidase family serine peptidase n=1 Tax=Alteromonas aquimaris TaxID=2998417 RepID=A0ABT3P5W9_9ALTE|nr:prolyl oligopeptidase family serine peptidase [Alteromonas aquimaris]MCW8108160.1 prolyl oligopeptidase family serine peptidase [Alteromonas aquimaris]
MKKITFYFAVGAISTALSACMTTTDSVKTQVETQSREVVRTVTPEVEMAGNAANIITLEQIMSDPDWLGRQPESPGFSLDGSSLVYTRKQQGSPITDVFAADLDTPSHATKVSYDQRHRFKYDEKVVSPDGTMTAIRAGDSIFVYTDEKLHQLTRGGSALRGINFMTDGRLMAQTGNRVIAIDVRTGVREQLISWKFEDKPEAVKPPEDYIAEQQIELIEYIKNKRNDRQILYDENKKLVAANKAFAPEPLYFNKKHRLVTATVSPAANFAIVVTTEDKPWRSDSDIMPHYIQENGRITSINARQRVADAEPENHDVWLVDLRTNQKHKLAFSVLPGYNEDVLAEVKAENAKAKGETYQVNRLPREITLLESWYWTEPSVRWHQNGQQVALMLEAWDNKDRWIATVDFKGKKLVNQHRLHDDAWINYRFNQFGWLHQSETLYFQSEHTGYSHLYVQQPGQSPVALTSGQYIVDNPTLTRDDDWIYFEANKKHPGIYEIYRVNLTTKQHETLTDLNGVTEYVLSPDEKHLLLTHSKVTRPPELYLSRIDSDKAPVQVTNTVSDKYLSLPWTAPQVVAINSSHTTQPIYARVYLPDNYEQGAPRKAVVFNHGAGYLQNAHLGWSGYFREYMFHSMLAQQGYVVLDMDYRASAGYGRDWRTAIYRQMGTPEVQDLKDGVNWLVENANVDRERIGTYGGSYGGFLTFMSLFNEPDLFQAGAALRPVSDWAHYNTGYTANILNTPNIDPIAYERSSPIYFAEGLTKPLLINAPMVDDNVFFVDVVRLVQRLIELEKENFETAIYPVEPHGFVQPSSWLDEYRRIYKLFETHL